MNPAHIPTMDPSALSQLYVAFLVALGLARALVARLADLLGGAVVLAVLGVGYLYASAVVHVRKFLSRSRRKRRFNRTL